MTSERFTQLVISDAVIKRIKEYREKLPELDRLKQEIKNREALLAACPAPDGKSDLSPLSSLHSPLEDHSPLQLKQEIKAMQAQCRAITQIKSGLPVLMYQATFDKTQSKKGYEGYWRKQSAARLNGLFMLDVDHVGEPRRTFETWIDRYEDGIPVNGNPRLFIKEKWAESLNILLVHVTPSGRGLRLVAVANAAIGNIADNQAALSKTLGVEPDVACKDASRCSFCPSLEDILYINKEKLFDYENKDYDHEFGTQYRGGNSQPTTSRAQNGNLTSNARPNASISGTQLSEQAIGEGAGVGVGTPEHAPALGTLIPNDQPSPLNPQISDYHGKSYEEICAKWFQLVCKGVPKSGDRHQSLYRLACDLRYITDFDPQLLARVLEECEVGRDIANERGSDEIKRIATDACALQHYRTIPKRMQGVLAAVGIQLDAADTDAAARKAAAIDYDAWWHRLEPLLSDAPGYREAVAQLPEHHRLAGVLVAGAMFGTYLTRCWWEHFDGKDYRLSFLVYIVGSAASGKSFIVDLDRLIMAPMLAADRVGREWERQYKEEMKKRSASSKNAKAEAPEQQHPVIRYVPSTISNAMLYRRLTDAIDENTFGPDGQPLHLHCYTLEPELATALRAQTGSWAGKNDLELKSFHNEYAGVDYANDQSVNGIIQVNWNQIVSGTQEAMSRKIKPSMVLDGLVTRLALFPMPGNDFAMIERKKAIRDHEREAYLRSVGLKLEQVAGELRCDRLVDFCYQYEKKLTDDARLEQDFCLDYFRKRIPVIMMRYTLVRIVLRQLERGEGGKRGEGEKRGERREESGERIDSPRKSSTSKSDLSPLSSLHSPLEDHSPREVLDGKSDLSPLSSLHSPLEDTSDLSPLSTLHSPLEVTDSDLEFARLIGDWCLMAQMHMFGEMVMEAQERERSNFVPRRRSTKIREAYARLPMEGITTELLVSEGVASNLMRAAETLRGWLADGLVTMDKKNYRKKYKEIPV